MHGHPDSELDKGSRRRAREREELGKGEGEAGGGGDDSAAADHVAVAMSACCSIVLQKILQCPIGLKWHGQHPGRP